MSTATGVSASPFGGMSLTELRSRASVERVARDAASARPILMPTARPNWDGPSQSDRPSFDVLLVASPVTLEGQDEETDEQAEYDDEFTPPRRTKIRIAFLVAVAVLVPLVAGLLIFLGLLWTTTGFSAPPDWLPRLLWYPPWALPAIEGVRYTG